MRELIEGLTEGQGRLAWSGPVADTVGGDNYDKWNGLHDLERALKLASRDYSEAARYAKSGFPANKGGPIADAALKVKDTIDVAIAALGKASETMVDMIDEEREFVQAGYGHPDEIVTKGRNAIFPR